MPRAQAPVLAHGPSLEAQPPATRAAPTGLKEPREAFREADGLPPRPWMRPGNFWLFGGQGVDSAGTIGLLNDLWEYNPVANQWTWIGPSASNVANQNGSYGTQGTGSGTTAPGGRQAAVLWADTSGNIWLFGGFGLDSAGTGNAGPPPAGAILNDLWEFNITTKQWTWVSGNNLANQTGTYGAEATAT